MAINLPLHPWIALKGILMSNNYGMAFAKCDNSKPHKPHSWRGAYLGLKKRYCEGIHKHFYKFIPEKSDTRFMHFDCEGCPETAYGSREAYRKLLMGDPLKPLRRLPDRNNIWR